MFELLHINPRLAKDTKNNRSLHINIRLTDTQTRIEQFIIKLL